METITSWQGNSGTVWEICCVQDRYCLPVCLLVSPLTYVCLSFMCVHAGTQRKADDWERETKWTKENKGSHEAENKPKSLHGPTTVHWLGLPFLDSLFCSRKYV